MIIGRCCHCPNAVDNVGTIRVAQTTTAGTTHFGDDVTAWTLVGARYEVTGTVAPTFSSTPVIVKPLPMQCSLGVTNANDYNTHVNRRDYVYSHSLESVPAGSHIQPFSLTRMDLPCLFVLDQGPGFNKAVIYAYRIWIDGVDKTGVVTLSTANELNIGVTVAQGSFAYAGYHSNLARIEHLFSPAISMPAAVPISFDLWTRLEVIANDQPGTYYVAAIETEAVHEFTDISHWTLDQLTVTFRGGDSNGQRPVDRTYCATMNHSAVVYLPANQDKFTFEPTDGWTFLKLTARQRLTHNATGDWIELNWESETAVVLYQVQDAPFTFLRAVQRYLPAATGDYLNYSFGQYNLSSGGVWDPNSTTVFDTGAFADDNNYPKWVPHAAVSGTYWPESVTIDLCDTVAAATGLKGYGNIGTNDVKLYYDGDGSGNGDIQHILMRTIVDIPQGSTVTSAILSFTADAGTLQEGFNYQIRFEDVDDASELPTGTTGFRSGATFVCDAVTLTLTSATESNFLDLVGAVEGDVLPFADLSPILQEVVDRPGFVSGNAVIIMIEISAFSLEKLLIPKLVAPDAPTFEITYT